MSLCPCVSVSDFLRTLAARRTCTRAARLVRSVSLHEEGCIAGYCGPQFVGAVPVALPPLHSLMVSKGVCACTIISTREPAATATVAAAPAGRALVDADASRAMPSCTWYTPWPGVWTRKLNPFADIVLRSRLIVSGSAHVTTPVVRSAVQFKPDRLAERVCSRWLNVTWLGVTVPPSVVISTSAPLAPLQSLLGHW